MANRRSTQSIKMLAFDEDLNEYKKLKEKFIEKEGEKINE